MHVYVCVSRVHMHVDGAFNPLETAMEWQLFAGALNCRDSSAKQTPNIWGFFAREITLYLKGAVNRCH